jgi:hypothetical protein
MSEPTPEEKARTIKLARQIMANMHEEAVGPNGIAEYVDNVRKLRGEPTQQQQAIHR